MVKVSKIEIEIGDKQISITPKQARELYQALGEFVGEKVERVERVIERERYPWYRWYYDSSTGTTSEQPLKPPYTITCTSDAAKISV